MGRSGRDPEGAGLPPGYKCTVGAIVARPVVVGEDLEVSTQHSGQDDVGLWSKRETTVRIQRYDWRSDALPTNTATLLITARRRAPDEPAESDRSARSSALAFRIGSP